MCIRDSLPPGFTATAQASSSSAIVVTVNIGAGAVIGANNISVTVGGVTSNIVTFAVDAPNITSISPNIQMIGSSNVQITIGGTGFLASPTVNLPPGFTASGQASSSTSIVVTANIGFNAMIGANNIRCV